SGSIHTTSTILPLPSAVIRPVVSAVIWARNRWTDTPSRNRFGWRYDGRLPVWCRGGAAVRDAFICSAVRTAVGRHGGALAEVRPDDLAAIVLKGAVERVGYDPARLDDVILGCTNQAGEDNRNVARMAALLAGFPIEIPGQTVNRLCGSGL